MRLFTYFPPPPLSAYVNMFWVAEDYHPAHPKERILPHGTMELLLNLSNEAETVKLSYPHDPHQTHSMRGVVVAGVRSQFFVVDTAQAGTYLSVWFKAGAAKQFFHTSGQELHNLHLPLETLWQQAAHDLYCQILEAKTHAQRFAILEATLLARLTRAPARHRVLDFALNAFQKVPQTHTVAQVLQQIGLSAPRFIHLFQEEVGLTPKLFCRITRLQHTLQLITQNPKPNWVDLALSAGYYDQAHFIHDFQALTGISPTQFAPQHPDHLNNLPIWD